MINPPYSLDKKDNSASREYPLIAKKNELEDKLKRISKQIRELKKKEQTASVISEIAKSEKEKKALDEALAKCEAELDANRMRRSCYI
ncbi:MAG: hypothetical protein ACLR0U_03625 [Enterocloster clostridioformis]